MPGPAGPLKSPSAQPIMNVRSLAACAPHQSAGACSSTVVLGWVSPLGTNGTYVSFSGW